MAQYRKFVVAVVGVVVNGFTAAQLENPWVVAGVALATALGVYVTPNA